MEAYDIQEDSIKIRFHGGETFLYTSNVTGEGNIEVMKRLARIGRGLAEFIRKNIREMYAARLA